ncbi:hypothetical protein [Candidatus Electronema sp. PJ]|uniref:hypothetical protein n=1 Tax=Candidatus Electronema sp. PJ TaxID=3401572 RepID=UPI003AA8526C
MQKFLGLLILLAVVVAAAFFTLGKEKISTLSGNSVAKKEAVMVTGRAGSEKIAFLQSEKVTQLLLEQGLRVNVKRSGSVAMVQESSSDDDFLWPASQINVESFKSSSSGMRLQQSADIFNSPIVLYSWDIVTEALIKAGIVQHKEGVNYIIDLPKLLELVKAKKQWKEIGLAQLYGSLIIRTTDPSKSNSGNMFAALTANTLNNGEVVTAESLDNVLPQVKDLYARLGYMEPSSSDLFEKFLQQGVGAYPMIVGYENQLVEYSLLHKEHIALLKAKVRILYPVPTVWASHPLIALSDKGRKLLTALKEPEIQKLAWEQHGFRSGLMGVENDPSVIEVVGLPKSIDAVMPMPSASVMDKITTHLSSF